MFKAKTARKAANKYEQKLSTASTWTTVKDYSSNGAAVFKPTATGTYNIRITAKDSSGKTAAKTLNVTVGDVLANTSSLSADKINLGETVTINASATGGSGSYTFACSVLTLKYLFSCQKLPIMRFS